MGVHKESFQFIFFLNTSQKKKNIIILLRYSFVMLSSSFRLLTSKTRTLIDSLDQRNKTFSVTTCESEVSLNTLIRDAIMDLNCTDNGDI